MNVKVKSFIEAAGATAEIAKVFYDGYLKAGFGKRLALILTRDTLRMMLSPIFAVRESDN